MATYDEITKSLKRAYDASAADRNSGRISPWKVQERALFLAELKQQNKTRLLELGSGPGRDGKFFEENGLSVVCTDLSSEMVSLCRDKGLEAHTVDFLSIDFPQNSFDAVFALNSLLHVPKASIETVLKRIDGLLQPKGLFYMGVYGGQDSEGIWFEDSQEPKRFFAYYRDDQIIELVSKIFELVSFRRIDIDRPGGLHFQSMTYRSKDGP